MSQSGVQACSQSGQRQVPGRVAGVHSGRVFLVSKYGEGGGHFIDGLAYGGLHGCILPHPARRIGYCQVWPRTDPGGQDSPRVSQPEPGAQGRPTTGAAFTDPGKGRDQAGSPPGDAAGAEVINLQACHPFGRYPGRRGDSASEWSRCDFSSLLPMVLQACNRIHVFCLGVKLDVATGKRNELMLKHVSESFGEKTSFRSF